MKREPGFPSLGLVTGFHRRALLDDSARFHRIMDAVTVAIEINDPWFKATADRWRTYTAPPGIF